MTTILGFPTLQTSLKLVIKYDAKFWHFLNIKDSVIVNFLLKQPFTALQTTFCYFYTSFPTYQLELHDTFGMAIFNYHSEVDLGPSKYLVRWASLWKYLINSCVNECTCSKVLAIFLRFELIYIAVRYCYKELCFRCCRGY